MFEREGYIEGKHAIVFDFTSLSSGETSQVFVKLPSIERIRPCLPVFQHFYRLVKQGGINDAEILCVDFEEIFKANNLPRQAWQGFMEECILISDFIVTSGEYKGNTAKLKELYKELPDLDKAQFEVTLLFHYALLHYVFPVSKANDLRACYTALDFMEYKELFMKSIEAMEAQSKEQSEAAI